MDNGQREIIICHPQSRCGICGGKLDFNAWLHYLLIHVPWTSPTWKGGMVNGFTDQLGISIVCNFCGGDSSGVVKFIQDRIKEVIEFKSMDIVYHEIEWLPSGAAELKNV